MTTKEKAIELVDKFHAVRQNPVKSSLIAVDEIIEATKTEIERPNYNGVVLDKFWQEVKTELENLCPSPSSFAQFVAVKVTYHSCCNHLHRSAGME